MVTVICVKCNKEFPDKANLDRHYKRKNPCDTPKSTVLSCEYCDKTFTRAFSVTRHYKSCKMAPIYKIGNDAKEMLDKQFAIIKKQEFEIKQLESVKEELDQLRSIIAEKDDRIKQLEFELGLTDSDSDEDFSCMYCAIALSSNSSIKRHYKACKKIPAQHKDALLNPAVKAKSDEDKKLAEEIKAKKDAYNIKMAELRLQTQIEKNKENQSKLQTQLEKNKELEIKLQLKMLDIPIPLTEETEDKEGCIYLLREREFIALDQHIYKIGRTKNMTNRGSGYPTGSDVIFTIKVLDMLECENIIKKEFLTKFKHRSDIGSEYFEGSPSKMLMILVNITSARIESAFIDNITLQEN
jgi:hypothetical protein